MRTKIYFRSVQFLGNQKSQDCWKHAVHNFLRYCLDLKDLDEPKFNSSWLGVAKQNLGQTTTSMGLINIDNCLENGGCSFQLLDSILEPVKEKLSIQREEFTEKIRFNVWRDEHMDDKQTNHIIGGLITIYSDIEGSHALAWKLNQDGMIIYESNTSFDYKNYFIRSITKVSLRDGDRITFSDLFPKARRFTSLDID